MVQKIGKLFFVATLWVGILCGQPQVSLHISDSNGQDVEELGVGIPFLVDVEIAGEGAGLSEPQVETDPVVKLVAGGTSSSIRSINGKTTVKKNYRFQGRVDREGTYTIGPAHVQRGAERFSSNSVQIEASRQQKLVHENHEKAFVQISTLKETIYRGEKILFSLRFYHLNNEVRVENIEEPKFPGCNATALKGPTTGRETIDGVNYRYLEWRCFLYPQSPGELVIPAVQAHVSETVAMDAHSRLDMFSMMDQMFGGRAQHKNMYSNSLTLDVQDLPAHDPPIAAVGKFTGFTSKVNLDTAAEGEGIVYTLELVGAGNFSMIGHPSIELPDGLKFYDSNSKLNALGANLHKKDFEYVVQGLQAGKYTIEPQTFTYFDVRQKAYRTLKSKPIKIIITPGTIPVKKEQKQKPTIDQTEISTLLPLEQGTKWRFRAPYFIPWLWFALCAFIPLLLWCVQKARVWWVDYQERNAPHYGYRNAFRKARTEIEKCKKDGTVAQLYHICIDLFAARLKLPKTEISENRIERALEQGGMDSKKIAAWKAFFVDITAAAFGSAGTMDKDNLCTVLLEWITKFEKVI
jgi:hypothetical protein